MHQNQYSLKWNKSYWAHKKSHNIAKGKEVRIDTPDDGSHFRVPRERRPRTPHRVSVDT